MPRWFRTAVKTVFILSCLGAAAYWFLATVYFGFVMAHAPLSPDPAHGITFPYDNHGTIHYFTKGMLALHFWTKVLGFVSLGLLMASSAVGLIFSKPHASED